MQRKNSNRASTLIEALVVLVIISLWILGSYNVFIESQQLSVSTKYRVEAIQIARDGLEAIQNIRDTNWILYAADRKNCWNVLNYDGNCVGDTTRNFDIELGNNQSFRIQRNAQNQFILDVQNHGGNNTISDTNFRNRFQIQKDARWFYTQGNGTNFVPLFTREIQITYFEDTNGDTNMNSNDEKMRVNSIVQWIDPSKTSPYTINMSTILSNWKE